MYKNKSVCVVIPAYNEETQIGRVIGTMPDFVEEIIIVDDLSSDNTVGVVEEYQVSNNRITLLKHTTNQGCGGSLATGCKSAS